MFFTLAVINLILTNKFIYNKKKAFVQVKAQTINMAESSSYLINGTYKLGVKLGSGSFGKIYSAVNVKTKQEVAVKIEEVKAKSPQLLYEARLYQNILGDKPDSVEGVPRVHYCCSQKNHNILVMDLLGPSLEDLFNTCNRKFSLKTVLMIADQMITRIEFVHSRGYIHRDIKPDNFLMGVYKKKNVVHVIDFGLSKRYVRDGKHIDFAENKKLTGTARYASINTHVGLEQSRRDDMEAMCYVWIYFLKGSLPWQGLKANSRQGKYEKIKEVKMSTEVEKLCAGLPQEFVNYLHYVKNLKFTDKPDYELLRQLFRDLFIKLEYQLDYEFDWSKKSKVSAETITADSIAKASDLGTRQFKYDDSELKEEEKIPDEKKMIIEKKRSSNRMV